MNKCNIIPIFVPHLGCPCLLYTSYAELKKGFVRITYQGDSFVVQLKDTENDLFWNNDVFRMNTQIISTAFRILNFSNVDYIGDTDIDFAKKNLGKNDVLIELCPLESDEFMELANEVCVLPPRCV